MFYIVMSSVMPFKIFNDIWVLKCFFDFCNISFSFSLFHYFFLDLLCNFSFTSAMFDIFTIYTIIYRKRRGEISQLKMLNQNFNKTQQKKTSHTTWTFNIKMQIKCLYNSYNKLKFWLSILVWEISSGLLQHPISAPVAFCIWRNEIPHF